MPLLVAATETRPRDEPPNAWRISIPWPPLRMLLRGHPVPASGGIVEATRRAVSGLVDRRRHIRAAPKVLGRDTRPMGHRILLRGDPHDGFEDPTEVVVAEAGCFRELSGAWFALRSFDPTARFDDQRFVVLSWRHRFRLASLAGSKTGRSRFRRILGRTRRSRATVYVRRTRVGRRPQSSEPHRRRHRRHPDLARSPPANVIHRSPSSRSSPRPPLLYALEP